MTPEEQAELAQEKRDRYMDDLFHTMDFISWNVIQDPLKPHEYKSFLQVKKEVDYLVEDYEKDHGIVKHIPEITVEEVCKSLLDKLPDNKRANKLAKAIKTYLGLEEPEMSPEDIQKLQETMKWAMPMHEVE